MKPKEFFLTKKGQNFKDDPKYLEEEKLIIQFLEDGRKNISQMTDLLIQKGFKVNWYTVEGYINVLLKEGFVKEWK